MTLQKYKHMPNTDYSSVKQSRRYITHGLYGCAAHWQHITFHKTHGLIKPRRHGQVKHFYRIYQLH